MTEKQRKVVDKGIKEGKITLDEIAKVAADGSKERSEMFDELQSHNVIIANELGDDMEDMLKEFNDLEEKPKAKRGRKPASLILASKTPLPFPLVNSKCKRPRLTPARV